MPNGGFDREQSNGGDFEGWLCDETTVKAAKERDQLLLGRIVEKLDDNNFSPT